MSEKQKRGFASLSAEQRSKIASKGGKTAHAKGLAHKWTHEEAVAAGRKGGAASHRPKPDVSDATVPADKTDAI